jgi:AGCS family alanine or glycine:cation symporter
VIDVILDAAAFLERLLWGPWLIALVGFVAVYLTIRTRFFQLRRLGLIFRTTFGSLLRAEAEGETGGDRPADLSSEDEARRRHGRMTPFQATSTALASTVGMGSIAGVATALTIGGPGAIFWMWLLALLGTITKTAEITLAVHYRDIDPTGRLRGGPMYYIRRGLGWPALAVVFSLGVFVNALCSASLLQAHTVGRAFLKSYGLNPYLVTGAMTLVAAVVVIGGVRRIGRVSERVVPLMAVVYVVAGLALMIAHLGRVPGVLLSIVHHAFAPAPALGGFSGAAVALAVREGIAKGMFGNEAGLGTAPMAHATADTSHPFRQGMWGAFEVFIVTFVICTITSFAVLSTGALASGESGIELVITAFSTFLPPMLAEAIISFCILTFCLTTQIGFFIYFETASVDVFGLAPVRWVKWLYFLPPVAFAGVADIERIWVFANIAVGVCAIPNLIAVLALSGVFLTLMRDYLDGRNRYATARVDGTGRFVTTGEE